MPAAALLVLACLLAPSPEVPAAPPAAGTTVAAPEPAPAPTPPSQPAPSAEAAPSTPSPAPVSSELVDPWAHVPVQTAVPVSPAPAPAPAPFTARTATHPPLLDPWAGGPRRGVPRKLDPELRDPFRDMRMHPPVPRLAQADLRDPFARSPAAAPVAPGPAVVRPEPPTTSMPLHPDLRDPFGRRKARPTPPPAAAPQSPVAPPPAPPAPAPTPGRERSGALPVTTRPFAHLFGAHRST